MLRFKPQTLLTCLIVALLSVVVAALAVTNFTPGTWLSGWDNLHPEFNFQLNVKRSIFATWQEYQGLGLLGGMSHAADLPRQLILWGLSAVVPAQILRYAWTFGMLWLGTVGAYFLLLDFFDVKTPVFGTARRLSSGVGAAFYLLNLATIQNFFVPYETFSTFYGFLPWLLLVTLRVFKQASLKNVLWLLIVATLATPAFYVQTLYIVWSLVVSVFALETIITQRLKGLRNVLLAGLVLMAANAYWLIPNLYFTLTSSHVTVDAKINQLATPEVQLMNQNRGGWLDIALLRGYWFDYTDYMPGQGYEYLLNAWRDYSAEPYALIVGLVLSAMITVGIVVASLKARRWRLSILLLFVLCLLMLTTGNGVLGWPFRWLSDHLPLFGQMFRTAFTKWSVMTSLIYAVGLSYFCYGVMRTSLKVTRIFLPLIFVVCVGLIAVPVLPAFTGNLISSAMRLPQPQPYQQLFDFFQTQPPEKRIAFLPAHTFWGWNFYDWHYRGSGFVWYGIEQPILDRAFDVWSPYNETFYQQLSTAVYSNDSTLVNNVLAQYDVSYLLLDESIAPANQPEALLRISELKKIMATLKAKEVFSDDFLHVYELPATESTERFIYSPSQVVMAETEGVGSRIDPTYQENGAYLSPASKASNHLTYPFAHLYQERLEGLTFENDHLILKQKLPEGTYDLVLSKPATGSAYVTTASFYYDGKQLTITFPDTTELAVGTKTLTLPQLALQTLPITQNVSTLVVELNDQTIEVNRRAATISAQVELQNGQPVGYSYYDQDAIKNTQGKLSIEAREVKSGSLSAQIWKPLDQSPRLKVEGGQDLTVTVKTTPQIINPNTLANSTNCDILRRGSIKKSSLVQGTVYEAFDQGSICEGLSIPGLSTHQAYLLRWQGENIKGRSLKFYLQNLGSNRADLEGMLPNSSFDESYSVLSWPSLPSAEYSLNWETKSYGSLSSENKIKALSFYSLPLDQLAHLKLIPKAGIKRLDSAAALSDHWKVGTFAYGFTTRAKTAESPLVLSQGYDAGWVAFRLPSDHRDLRQYQQLEHLKYNGWANAWILPEGEYDVLILYWPQLLSFGGYGLLILTVIGFGLTYATLRVRKRR